MKYWLYENKRITGPLDAEALMRRPGFGGRSLVCPADRTGQAPGDWAAASTVPELIGGPSRPPAPPVALAPDPPGFDSERVASEFEGLRRTVAALEMRLKQMEEAETRVLAKADSRQAGVDDRLEKLSDAIAAQDVRAEATDAALVACRASLNDLGDAVDEANTHIENAVRKVLEQAGASKEIEAVRTHIEGAVRDGLAGLHRLIRAAELKVDTVLARADGLEAAHAAQKSELEASLRNIIAESDPTKTMVALHERLDRLARALSETQTRIADAEERRRLGGPAFANADELDRSFEALGGSLHGLEGSLKDLEGRVAELAARPDPASPLAAKVAELSSSLEELDSRLGEVKEGLSKLEARPAAGDAKPSTVPVPPGDPGAVEATARDLDALAVRVSELERRPPPPPPAPAPAPPPADPGPLAAKVEGLATGLVAVQKRFVELEGREARLNSLGGRLEDLARGLEELRESIARLESKAPETARLSSDPRIEGLAKTLAALRDRLMRLEPALKPQPGAPAPEPPRRAPWLFAAGGSVTAAAALGVGLWLGRASAPTAPALAPQPVEPPASVASQAPAEPVAPAPVPEPVPVQAAPAPPAVPAPEPPPMAPAPAKSGLLGPLEPSAEAPRPPVAKRRPKEQGDGLPGFASPAPEPPRKRTKTAGQKVVYSVKPAKVVPGEVQLVQAVLKKDGVVLKLSEPIEPKASFANDPPRLVLDFAKAPSDLPPKDLGGLAPHILQFRVRHADLPPRLLWVEVQLDKAGGYRLRTQGDTVIVSLELQDAPSGASSSAPAPAPARK